MSCGASRPRSSPLGKNLASARTNPTSPSGPSTTEGVGFEPTRPFRVNALAGRRLKPLGHPSTFSSSAPTCESDPLLPRQGSNLDSSDPESDVLPVTPRGILSDNNQSQPELHPSLEGLCPTTKEPPVGLEPTTPSLRMTCSTAELRWRPSGAEGSRTPDLLSAIQALSQLSYGPSAWAREDSNLWPLRCQRSALTS